MTKNRLKALDLMGVSKKHAPGEARASIVQEAQIYALFDLTDAILEGAADVSDAVKETI